MNWCIPLETMCPYLMRRCMNDERAPESAHVLKLHCMEKNIVVIEGDGIGPEVTRQAVKVLNAIAEQFGHEFNYQLLLNGRRCH